MLQLESQIIASAYTVDMAYHQVAVLQTVLETAVYHARGGTARPLVQRYQAELERIEDEDDKGALRSWGTEWLDGLGQENLREELQSVRDWLKKVPTLLVYVPVSFDVATTAELSSWAREEIHASLLLDLKVDANMIGGCAFVQNGVFYDRSLHGRLRLTPEVVSEVLDTYDT
jgi:hypothetical protein